MTNTIEIYLQRVRERQYSLNIGDYVYGDWISKSRATEIADHVEQVLLDLQTSGIIPPDVVIKREVKIRDDRDK